MAALDFPSSPATGQVYSANGKSWAWDGTTWLLQSGAPAAASFMGCRAYNSAVQAIANTTEVALTLDTELFDTAALHSTSVNTSRFTVPAGGAGYYTGIAGGSYAANSTGSRYIYWKKNGTAPSGSEIAAGAIGVAVGPTVVQAVLQPLYLIDGDYVEAFTYQSSGGSLNIGGVTDEPRVSVSVWKVDGIVGPQGFGRTQNIRLYSTTGTPIPSTDTTTVSTIYVGPDGNGNICTLLTAADQPISYEFVETSLALSSLTSGKPYDVFLYLNGATPAIELSAAWTNDTTRSDAIALVKGFWVKSSDHTRLHVGTIYTTGTTSTADTAAKRFVWNRYNRQLAFMKNVPETTDSWAYSSSTFRQANANTANQLDYVTGDAGIVVEARAVSEGGNTGVLNGMNCGIGVNSTTTNSALQGSYLTNPVAGAIMQIHSEYKGRPGLGRNFLTWLEATSGGTGTWYGDGGAVYQLAGIAGTLKN